MQTESSNLIMNGLNPPTHHQVTEQLMVPDQLVGLIIGKQGEVGNPEPWRIVLVPELLVRFYYGFLVPAPGRNCFSRKNLSSSRSKLELVLKTVPVLVLTVPTGTILPAPNSKWTN